MCARENVHFCRLAGCFVIAILVWGTTVSAGEIVITIDDGQYFESVIAYEPVDEIRYGLDINAPEKVEIDQPYVTAWYSGDVYQVYLGAQTIDKGPECKAALMIEAEDPGLWTFTGPYGHHWTRGQAIANTKFDFVVYNVSGTDTELIVPLVAKGTLTAKAYHQEHGTIHAYLYEEPLVSAYASIEFYHYNDTVPISEVTARFDHQPPSYFLASDIIHAEEKPWLLTVPILVGKNPGDRAYYTVRQVVQLSGLASAFSPDEDNPERLFYSKVAAWAAVDPFFYIDPSWEHADKFAVALPDNVTPLTEEWDEVVFADGFDGGFTLLWSSTVP